MRTSYELQDKIDTLENIISDRTQWIEDAKIQNNIDKEIIKILEWCLQTASIAHANSDSEIVSKTTTSKNEQKHNK